jgi:transposase
MRPPKVFANVSAAAENEILSLLHGPFRTATRLVMMLLSSQGWSPAEIGSLLDYHPGTVRRWISRFDGEGCAGLADRPRPGRPRLGGPRLLQRIQALLASPRAWTIGRLWRHLGRPKLSLATLRRRVGEVAAWRRPRLVAKGDPDAQTVTAGIRATVADLPEGSVVLAADEAHVSLLAWIRATWVLRGARQKIWTPGKNVRRTVFGALNVVTGTWHYLVCAKAASAQFIDFCTMLLAAYPTAPVVVVITDGGTCHTSKITREWVDEQPRLRLLIGASYSPQDNPVERIWGALKRWLANNPTATINDRVRQVHAFFRNRTPAQMLTTAAPHSSPWLPEGYAQNLCVAA